MDITLHLESQLLLDFAEKIGAPHINKLLKEYLTTYATLCMSREYQIETAITESKQDICNKMLTEQQVTDIVTAKLNNVTTTRDLDHMTKSITSQLLTREDLNAITDSNNKNLDLIKSHIILEFNKVTLGNVEHIKEQLVTNIDKLKREYSNDNLEQFRVKLLHELSQLTLKSDLSSITDTLDQLQSQTTTLSKVLSINSSIKGAATEDLFEVQLHKSFPSAEIERTSSISHAGDFIITIDQKRYLIDVKNYKQNVPKREIIKLKRDLVETKVDGAIMVSINSGIAGINRIGISNELKPIVLLPNNGLDMDMIGFAISLINTSTVTEDTIGLEQYNQMVFNVTTILKDFDNSIALIKNTRQRILNALNNKHHIESNANSFICPHCKKVYKSKTGLKSHIKYKHK